MHIKFILPAALRHLAYTVAWKKIGPLWSLLIKARRLGCATPMLETVLQGRRRADRDSLKVVPRLLRWETPQDADSP